MRRRWIGWLALWLVGGTLACATLPKPVDSGLLVFWEISSPGDSGGHAHLLGSVHFGREATAFDPVIEAAFADAAVLVFEVAPGQADATAVTQLLLELGRLDPGQSLPDLLDEETWEALAARLQAAGLSAMALSSFEPWVAMIQVIGLDIADAGLDGEHGIEEQLLTRAGGKPTLGLETARFQLELFDQLPLETQVTLLEDSLQDGGKTNREGIDLILAAWQAGDTALLERLTQGDEGDEHTALFQERIFAERNRNMAARLAELLEQPTHYFVTIGAGHTVGEGGVPALLRERGYRVRRVPRTRP